MFGRHRGGGQDVDLDADRSCLLMPREVKSAPKLSLRVRVRIRESSQLGGTHANKPNNLRSDFITIRFIINLSSHMKILLNGFGVHKSLLIFSLYNGSELIITKHLRV